METNSSGEELVLKTRKPYTITKQREKWTEEEHNKFVEALKLYGRAWQRIEEHIGTKTAVQIRSHAQKFFTKLEKEAAMKGVPFGQAHDIEIPPPRPKRKPNSPYPRKTGASSMETTEEKISMSPSPLSASRQATDIENNATWKIRGMKDNSKDGNCAEVINLFQDASAASLSSPTTGSSSLYTYNGFMPLEKEMANKMTLKGSSISLQVNRDVKGNGASNRNHGNEEAKGTHATSQMTAAQEERAGELDKTDTTHRGGNLQADQDCTKHVPFDFMKRSVDRNVPATAAGQTDACVTAKPSLSPMIPSSSEVNASSGISSIHQTFPGFPPFNQFPGNQDAYRSFLNMSSAFSSLLVSTLLQNPAVHAAASVAASFWPSAGLDASVNSSSESVHEGMPTRQMDPTPSMAAIAAATVAAAAAWWATQGLLPMYPLHAGFAFASPPTTMIPTVDTARAPENKKGDQAGTFEHSVGIDQQDMDPEQSEAVQGLRNSSKSLPSSPSSESDENARCEVSGANASKSKPVLGNEVQDSDVARSKKKLDRSSCGSNTPSSSEVETDAVLKKQDGERDEPKQALHPIEPKQAYPHNPQSTEANNRRARCSGSMNESWKEVSEEGRLAFRALFNRGVLPQSFSPPQAEDPMIMTAKDKEGTNELPVDLNVKASSDPTDLCCVQGLHEASAISSLTSEISPCKMKARRTGFKPYKRCSIEAKESRGTAGDETGNKRIRLESEASV